MPLNSYIRVLHASPDAPPVDVYANDMLIAQNLAFNDYTNYLSVPPGNYIVEVFPTGEKVTPVVYSNLTIPTGSAFTIAAIGNLENIGLYPIPEEYTPPQNGKYSYVRFVHLSPNAPPVDIALPNGTQLFEDVEYEEYTNYMRVNPATYTFEVKPTGSNDIVLSVPDVTLEAGKIYTAYATGLVDGEPPLGALLTIDNQYK